jgi:O-antigen/teichoic acid export membrane protein
LGVWNSTVFPIVSRLFADDQAQALKFIHKYQRLTFLLCIPIAFFITFASPIIVQVLFGISYLPSAIALQILIWNMVVVSISGTYWMLILVPLGRTKEVMYAVASGALTNIILNILLIPPFSFVGAAAATLITEIVVAVIMSFFALREVKVGLLGFIVKPLIGGALSFLLALLSLYYLVDVNIIYRYMIASLLFTVSYLLFILLSGEWRIIKQFIGEIFA